MNFGRAWYAFAMSALVINAISSSPPDHAFGQVHKFHNSTSPLGRVGCTDVTVSQFALRLSTTDKSALSIQSNDRGSANIMKIYKTTVSLETLNNLVGENRTKAVAFVDGALSRQPYDTIDIGSPGHSQLCFFESYLVPPPLNASLCQNVPVLTPNLPPWQHSNGHLTEQNQNSGSCRKFSIQRPTDMSVHVAAGGIEIDGSIRKWTEDEQAPSANFTNLATPSVAPVQRLFPDRQRRAVIVKKGSSRNFFVRSSIVDSKHVSFLPQPERHFKAAGVIHNKKVGRSGNSVDKPFPFVPKLSVTAVSRTLHSQITSPKLSLPVTIVSVVPTGSHTTTNPSTNEVFQANTLFSNFSPGKRQPHVNSIIELPNFSPQSTVGCIHNDRNCSDHLVNPFLKGTYSWKSLIEDHPNQKEVSGLSLQWETVKPVEHVRSNGVGLLASVIATTPLRKVTNMIDYFKNEVTGGNLKPVVSYSSTAKSEVGKMVSASRNAEPLSSITKSSTSKKYLSSKVVSTVVSIDPLKVAVNNSITRRDGFIKVTGDELKLVAGDKSTKRDEVGKRVCTAKIGRGLIPAARNPISKGTASSKEITPVITRDVSIMVVADSGPRWEQFPKVVSLAKIRLVTSQADDDFRSTKDPLSKKDINVSEVNEKRQLIRKSNPELDGVVNTRIPNSEIIDLHSVEREGLTMDSLNIVTEDGDDGAAIEVGAANGVKARQAPTARTTAVEDDPRFAGSIQDPVCPKPLHPLGPHNLPYPYNYWQPQFPYPPAGLFPLPRGWRYPNKAPQICGARGSTNCTHSSCLFNPPPMPFYPWNVPRAYPWPSNADQRPCCGLKATDPPFTTPKEVPCCPPQSPCCDHSRKCSSCRCQKKSINTGNSKGTTPKCKSRKCRKHNKKSLTANATENEVCCEEGTGSGPCCKSASCCRQSVCCGNPWKIQPPPYMSGTFRPPMPFTGCPPQFASLCQAGGAYPVWRPPVVYAPRRPLLAPATWRPQLMIPMQCRQGAIPDPVPNVFDATMRPTQSAMCLQVPPMCRLPQQMGPCRPCDQGMHPYGRLSQPMGPCAPCGQISHVKCRHSLNAIRTGQTQRPCQKCRSALPPRRSCNHQLRFDGPPVSAHSTSLPNGQCACGHFHKPFSALYSSTLDNLQRYSYGVYATPSCSQCNMVFSTGQMPTTTHSPFVYQNLPPPMPAPTTPHFSNSDNPGPTLPPMPYRSVTLCSVCRSTAVAARLRGSTQYAVPLQQYSVPPELYTPQDHQFPIWPLPHQAASEMPKINLAARPPTDRGHFVNSRNNDELPDEELCQHGFLKPLFKEQTAVFDQLHATRKIPRISAMDEQIFTEESNYQPPAPKSPLQVPLSQALPTLQPLTAPTTPGIIINIFQFLTPRYRNYSVSDETTRTTCCSDSISLSRTSNLSRRSNTTKKRRTFLRVRSITERTTSCDLCRRSTIGLSLPVVPSVSVNKLNVSKKRFPQMPFQSNSQCPFCLLVPQHIFSATPSANYGYPNPSSILPSQTFTPKIIPDNNFGMNPGQQFRQCYIDCKAGGSYSIPLPLPSQPPLLPQPSIPPPSHPVSPLPPPLSSPLLQPSLPPPSYPGSPPSHLASLFPPPTHPIPSLPRQSHSLPPLARPSHSLPPLLRSSHSLPPLLRSSHSLPPLPRSSHLLPPFPRPSHSLPSLPRPSHSLSRPPLPPHRTIQPDQNFQQCFPRCNECNEYVNPPPDPCTSYVPLSSTHDKSSLSWLMYLMWIMDLYRRNPESCGCMLRSGGPSAMLISFGVLVTQMRLEL